MPGMGCGRSHLYNAKRPTTARTAMAKSHPPDVERTGESARDGFNSVIIIRTVLGEPGYSGLDLEVFGGETKTDLSTGEAQRLM